MKEKRNNNIMMQYLFTQLEALHSMVLPQKKRVKFGRKNQPINCILNCNIQVGTLLLLTEIWPQSKRKRAWIELTRIDKDRHLAPKVISLYSSDSSGCRSLDETDEISTVFA